MEPKVNNKQKDLLKKAQELTGVQDMNPDQIMHYSGKDKNVQKIVDDYKKEDEKVDPKKESTITPYKSAFEKYTFQETQEPIVVIKKSWRTDYSKFYKEFKKDYQKKLNQPKQKVQYTWFDNHAIPNSKIIDYGTIMFADTDTIIFIRNSQPRIVLNKSNFFCDYYANKTWNIAFKDGSLLCIKDPK